jgi:uncharacterized repeat protein (TIGR01451 family)
MVEDHDPVKPGDSLVYSLTVANPTGQSLPLSAAGAVTATIPVGASFVSATGAGTASGNVVTWNLGAVAAGGSTRLSYTVSVGASLASGAALQAKAEVLDGTKSLARSLVATEVKAASPLTLTVSAAPDPVVAYGILSYTISVNNVSGSALNNVLLTDVTQNGATALVAQITGGGGCPTVNSSYCAAGVIVSWPAFSLAAGASMSFTVGVQVANGTVDGTLIHNLAQVSSVGGTVSQGRDAVVHH